MGIFLYNIENLQVKIADGAALIGPAQSQAR